ncbi:MAG: hypothetical protein G01um101418_930 [Parcubacteria group bacterium Gr01-1014_18]|nr:MAG: hypothetical protein Greene041636_909 [Parcubacteria group bacterium Greene0416_36]TSC79766.1 MAG: hypothetical protein G01um101418_930 [Parcubacteria group bacterium Gr01-1014_18]TSC97968.1 MAG: hypothetical protein Greene101420_925 [Parcubacteria group bacterium Greene1014_20]TSD06597.1 MAG: hypothetical protein Greene07142_736 [Parcubacteria group bacterium Greene0714_2]
MKRHDRSFSKLEILLALLAVLLSGFLLVAQGFAEESANWGTQDPKAMCTANGFRWCGLDIGGFCLVDPAKQCPSPDQTGTNPTPPPVNMQQDCASEGGKWCLNFDGQSGWCNRDPKGVCPAYNEGDCRTQNKIWCVDPNRAGSVGWCTDNCPFQAPSADQVKMCTDKGGHWCKTPDGVGGYCALDPNQKCPVYNPSDCALESGLWCPDMTLPQKGFCNYHSKECPQMMSKEQCVSQNRPWCEMGGMGYCATMGVVCPVPNQQETICPGGLRVPAGKMCPPQEGIRCPDGRMVPDIKMCSESNFQGFKCSNGMMVGSMDQCPPMDGKPMGMGQEGMMPQFEKPHMSGEQFSSQKQFLFKELSSLEVSAKRVGDKELLAQMALLRVRIEKLEGVLPEELPDMLRSIHDEMQSIRMRVDELRQKEGEKEQQKRDQEFKKRMLKEMQQRIKPFERFLNQIKNKIKKLEAKKIKIDSEILENLKRAEEILARIKAAKSFDEIEDIIEEMPDVAQSLNEVLPRLELLARLPQMIAFLERQIRSTDIAVKRAESTVKKLKLDATEELLAMKKLMSLVGVTMAQIKSGNFEDDVDEFVRESIMESLEEVRDRAQVIQSVADARRQLSIFTRDIRSIEREIATREKNKEDVREEKAKLGEIKTHLTLLGKWVVAKPSAETRAELFDVLGELFESINEIKEQLDLLVAPSFEKEFEKLFQEPLVPDSQRFELKEALISN